jgi:hypothetical protein
MNNTKKIHIGKGYKSEDIKLLLNYLDELVKLYNWYPDTGGGKDSINIKPLPWIDVSPKTTV